MQKKIGSQILPLWMYTDSNSTNNWKCWIRIGIRTRFGNRSGPDSETGMDTHLVPEMDLSPQEHWMEFALLVEESQ